MSDKKKRVTQRVKIKATQKRLAKKHYHQNHLLTHMVDLRQYITDTTFNHLLIHLPYNQQKYFIKNHVDEFTGFSIPNVKTSISV